MVSVDVHHDAGGCRTSLLCIRALKQPRSTRALSQAQGNDPIDEGSGQSSSKNNDRSVFKYCFLKCLQFKKRTSVSGCPSSFTLDACQTYIPPPAQRHQRRCHAAPPRRRAARLQPQCTTPTPGTAPHVTLAQLAERSQGAWGPKRTCNLAATDGYGEEESGDGGGAGPGADPGACPAAARNYVHYCAPRQSGQPSGRRVDSTSPDVTALVANARAIPVAPPKPETRRCAAAP
jgi:hypothetical protein